MSMRTALMEMANNQLDEVKSVDYGKRMTDAQKKKFHDLKKKMTGGPEYQKIMRKNQSPVKSDDEFHNLVLKKAMSEERAAWVPESILDDDVSHFMGAAAAAKKAGKSDFDFGGKKYKVTMKHDAAKKIGESAGCAECGPDGECQCEQPVQEAKVDELSTKTMKSYVKKASKQRDKAGDSYSNAALRRHDFAPDTPAMKKNAIKYKKRDSGVDMAQKKLAAR